MENDVIINLNDLNHYSLNSGGENETQGQATGYQNKTKHYEHNQGQIQDFEQQGMTVDMTVPRGLRSTVTPRKDPSGTKVSGVSCQLLSASVSQLI